MSEQEAVDRLRQQDPTGLEVLMRLYGGLVLYVVRQIMAAGPTGDIEECATDVWLSVWQKASLYNPERSSFKTWICLLSRHQAIDHLRRRHDPAAGAMSLDDERLTAVRLELQDIPEFLETKEDARVRSIRLNKALSLLPEAERNLIVRRYYFFEEITDLAQEAGVTRAVIDNRLARSRKRLRVLYREVSEHGT